MDRLQKEPLISVGIVHAVSVEVDFRHGFKCKDSGLVVKGCHTVSYDNGCAMLDGTDVSGLMFTPLSEAGVFSLMNVQIGIGFHWDRHETQTFAGSLKFVVDACAIWAVNVVGVESYLRCVISSEMNAMSDIELLKAHSVTSRSWLMAQVWGKGRFCGFQKQAHDGRIITWRDREDHDLFDVCADDHCQRYQGVGRISNRNVDKAINETRGLILTYNGDVCDARFSKCCGGVTETFETCWANDEHPYLTSFHDGLLPPKELKQDLRTEAGARAWVSASPDVFCNTSDAGVLRQVLNDYDQVTTPDFFRWRVTLSADEIRSLIHTKAGYDLGDITDLVPLKRGPSGRIFELRIVGARQSVVVGKELEIRRLLSPTHLYSSAFVVDKSDDGRTFSLSGAGWGHGVGLCQIGAAVMARKGFSFHSILYHYFRRATIERLWD